MTVRHAAPARPRAIRHGRGRRSYRALRGVALVAVALMAFGVSGAAALYQQLNGNITSSDVSNLVTPLPQSTATATEDGAADPNAGQPVNILLLGSDERDGENEAIGGYVGGMRSDTSIVAHISADRTRVELISIPRDSLVNIPSCTMSDGSTTSAQSSAMFNSAFSIGADAGGDIASAAACTWNTVQTNTGVPINHFVVVDFSGFTNMIDAIGGVEMCIESDMSSPKAGLYLNAGNQTLDGTQALAFARARYGIGDGSDTQRLGRQQELLAAVMRQLLSKNILTDWTQLVRFLDQATASLSVDSGFSSITDMAALGYSLRGISSDNISFMTIPVTTAPNNANRLVWTDEANTIWDNIANDRPMMADVGDSDTTTDSTTDGTAAADTTDGITTTDESTGTAEVATPAPQETREAGKESFTANDVTSVCG